MTKVDLSILLNIPYGNSVMHTLVGWKINCSYHNIAKIKGKVENIYQTIDMQIIM